MNVSLDVYGKDISVHILTAATQFVFHQGCYLEHPKEGELSLTYCGPYDNMFLQRGLNLNDIFVPCIADSLDVLFDEVLSFDKAYNLSVIVGKEKSGAFTPRSEVLKRKDAFLLVDMIQAIYNHFYQLCCKIPTINVLVPLFYNNQQRQILQLVKNQSLDYAVNLVKEDIPLILPYLYYNNINKQDSTIFLYYFGHYHCVYFIIRVWRGNVTFLHTHTLTAMSGSSITRLVEIYISKKYYDITQSKLIDDVKNLHMILDMCDKAKIILSTRHIYRIPFTSIGGKVDITLTRDELESLLIFPLTVFKKHILKSFRSIKMKYERIDYVISTGGNSKIPAIQQLIQQLFPFANRDCGTTISYSTTLGSNLLLSNRATSIKKSKWCYRIKCSCNSSCSSIIGNSLQCINHDIMIIPLYAKQMDLDNVVITLERCPEDRLVEAMNHSSIDLSSTGLAGITGLAGMVGMAGIAGNEKTGWEPVYSYNYDIKSKPLLFCENMNTTIVGVENESSPYIDGNLPQLENNCMKIDSQIAEDESVHVSICLVTKGSIVLGSSSRFSYIQNRILENTSISSKTPINNMFSTKVSPSLPSFTSSSSITSSSIIPELLADRSKSVILSIKPSEAKEKTIFIQCYNRHLRVQNLPQLLNPHPELCQLRSKNIKTPIENKKLKKESLPRFSNKPFTKKQMKRFTRSGNEYSPVSYCCYEGNFVNGKRSGFGTSFTITKDVIYVGTWGNNHYEGAGERFDNNGYCMKGMFSKDGLSGKGVIVNAEGHIVYSGEFKNNQKEGEGKEVDLTTKVIYEGTFKNNKREGKGVLKSNNKEIFSGTWYNNQKHGLGHEIEECSIYEGSYQHGMKHGKGVQTCIDGRVIYTGDWMFDTKHGIGKLYSKNDIYYEGEFENDMRSGKGKHYQNDILFYDGMFLNNEKHGYGKLYYRNQKLWKEGQFKNGKLNGEGTIYKENGDLYYTGFLVDDIPNGKGTRSETNREVFEGNFVNGELHGLGIISKNGVILYSGQFKYGRPHGVGKLREDRGLYEGEFVNGEKEGKGVYTFVDGNVYSGEFKDGYFNGYGTYSNESGVLYEGEWRNGQRCGIGRCFFSNHEYYHGSFLSNMMCGQGCIYYPSGALKYQGEFRNDKRNGEGIEYDENGKILSKGYYVNDIRCL